MVRAITASGGSRFWTTWKRGQVGKPSKVKLGSSQWPCDALAWSMSGRMRYLLWEIHLPISMGTPQLHSPIGPNHLMAVLIILYSVWGFTNQMKFINIADWGKCVRYYIMQANMLQSLNRFFEKWEANFVQNKQVQTIGRWALPILERGKAGELIGFLT